MARLTFALCLILAAIGAGPAAAQTPAQTPASSEKDPVVLVRLTPEILAQFADPDLLLRQGPLEMSKYDEATKKDVVIPPVTDCSTLRARQEEGYYTYTSQGMAQETVVSDVCRMGERYAAATFEETTAPKHTLHADVLDLWSAWFQLAVSANVADSVAEAVERGVSLGAFHEPSLESCGPRAVERKDPWTITARNKCDGLYLSIVGEEFTASGKVRPVVFYHLNATGGSLRTGGYTAVDRHPASGVWTPVQFLSR
ncbi:hypothetical protein [Thalassobaculum salexigens]|uniref:hypothetical protein n=1 Tax=Thalassobaculum salexigens TaxID=455360 RepID=UPI0003FBA513|nr:hypothetical protein [Thalassobaculum salexigens]